jgi:hypothetical protein
MTIEQVRQMHRAQPFQPFELYLADGRSLNVSHPELLAIHGQGRTVAIAVPDGAFEIVDLLLVTSLKPVTNGSGKHRRRGTQ